MDEAAKTAMFRNRLVKVYRLSVSSQAAGHFLLPVV